MADAPSASLREITSAVRQDAFGRAREPSTRSAAGFGCQLHGPTVKGAVLRPVDARSYTTTVSHLRNLKPYAEA